jgi:CRISPR-associated protein Csx3
MPSYKIQRDGDVLRVGFGDPAQNDVIIRDAVARLAEIEAAGELTGGGMIKVNGPASLPVAVALAHALSHKFSAIGVFDPKLNKYVVAVSHDPAFMVGDLVD